MSRKKVHFWIHAVFDTVCQYGSRAQDDFDDTTDPRQVTCLNCVRQLPKRGSTGWRRLVKRFKDRQDPL